MKTITKIAVIFLVAFSIKINCTAQNSATPEKYGKTLNVGLGLGYYGYIGHSLPVFTANYEFDVAKNFTLAPFLGIYSYRDYYYWGNPNKPYWDPSYHQYYYRETAMPVGVKGTYYFDQLLHANSKWDFYAAGSLGFVIRNVVWENGYNGNRTAYSEASPLYLGMHIGTEYHLNQKTGLFLDLSTGVSTFGLAVHL